VDLVLFGRVLWRFRVIAAAGVAAAIVLAFFAAVRVRGNGLEYRSQEKWVSYSRVFVTETGFPWGAVRATSADPARFASLAILYANLADSDAVHRLAFGAPSPSGGQVEIAPVLASQNTNDALPLISIAGISTSKRHAVALAAAETKGLLAYVGRQQNANDIASENRVVLQVVKQPTTASLLARRSQTLPIVVFLTVLIAVCALLFVLENLRPRGGQLSGQKPPLEPMQPPRPAAAVWQAAPGTEFD
jgi:hypothetical protein